MFATSTGTAMIPVTDLARAKRWYEAKLGLTPSEDLGEMEARYKLAGANALMYPTSFAGTTQDISFTAP